MNEENPEKIALKPCPFCGYEAKVSHDTSSDYERQWTWGVYCQRQWPNFEQECSGSVCGFKTEVEAVTWWNKRAPVKCVHDWLKETLKQND